MYIIPTDTAKQLSKNYLFLARGYFEALDKTAL